MVKVTALRRFPYGGKYRKPGESFKMPKKLAHVLVVTGKAEYAVEKTADAVKAAKDYAEENGVDLSDVDGTGKDGRILKRDVSSYMTRMMASR